MIVFAVRVRGNDLVEVDLCQQVRANRKYAVQSAQTLFCVINCKQLRDDVEELHATLSHVRTERLELEKQLKRSVA